MASHKGWTSAELLSRYRRGDSGAADELFARYVDRLSFLARSRLSPRLASRTDPEDVVMSAWRSFFVGARAGRFRLRRSGDLWRLLVSITMHKLYRQVRRHTADVRTVDAERPLESLSEDEQRLLAPEPTPDEAVAVAEEMESIMAGLEESERRVLELRLQGEPLPVIAAETGRSERTVRRTLAVIREKLSERLRRASDEQF